MGGWLAGGLFFQETFPLSGSILQAEICQILSLAKNPRWSRVWQKLESMLIPSAESTLKKEICFQAFSRHPYQNSGHLPDITKQPSDTPQTLPRHHKL